MNFCGCRDWDSSRLGNSVVVETETHRDWEILWLSRPRLIETGNFVVVETETHRDWEILWLSRPRLIETGNFCGCRDRDQPRLNKSCRDRDFIESLADLCLEAPERRALPGCKRRILEFPQLGMSSWAVLTEDTSHSSGSETTGTLSYRRRHRKRMNSSEF